MTIGNNIKRLRAESGLTQDQLGERVGVTGKAVCTWELGLKTPRMPVIERRAAVVSPTITLTATKTYLPIYSRPGKNLSSLT